MTPAFWFWAIYVLSIIFGIYRGYSDAPSRPYWINSIVFYVLVGLLGWAVFGGPLKG
jgi:hypothetical protein